MKIKEYFKFYGPLVKWKSTSLMTMGYGLGYSLIFGLIFGKGWPEVISQSPGWLLIMGILFYGITNGVGILTVFYALISLGLDRKKIFQIWSSSLLLNIFYPVLIIGLSLVLSLFIKSELRTSLLAGNIFNRNTLTGSGPVQLGAYILLVVGISLLLALVIAFFSAIGVRFGWEITVGTVFLILALVGYLFIKDINILVTTGHYLYAYLAKIWALAGLLYGGIYALSQKWEVKN